MNWYRQSQRTFKESSVLPVLAKTRSRVEEYEECPHCGKEVGEKEWFTEDFKVYVHRPCGGRCTRGNGNCMTEPFLR